MTGNQQEIRSFRDLTAWQKAFQLSLTTYQHTRAFPADERFGLVNQMRRASVSIATNIAEGYGRGGRADYIRMVKLARGSLYELETQAALAAELGFLADADASDLEAKTAEVGRILNGLIRALERPATS